MNKSKKVFRALLLSKCALLLLIFSMGCGGMAIFALKKNPLWISINPKIDLSRTYRVAVLDFVFIHPTQENRLHGKRMTQTAMTVYTHAGRMIASNLTSAMLTLKNYELVERSQIERILNEQGLGLSGVLAKRKAEDIGQILNVDAVIIGEVEECVGWMNVNTGMIGALVSFSARMVDINSGKIMWTASHSANLTKITPPQCIRILCRDIVDQLKEEMK